MRITIIDKDQFANLLRYGSIILPGYSFSEITEELPEADAVRLLLACGNPIEYPSQYIIVRYKNETNDDRLYVSSIDALIATDADSRKLFSTQFRKDLIIQPEKYNAVFSAYLNNDFLKQGIQNGIIAFRRLCGLDCESDYSEFVEMVFRGKSNRLKYRHHYLLPAEERLSPYPLMISYDRHAPYPKGWAGYFCDVVETYCYYKKPDLGYSEAVAERTNIYKAITDCGAGATSKEIHEAIMNEPFTQGCNEFFTLPGGYLVPYIFFILRDRFRDADSFVSQRDFVEQIKRVFPDAFDTACTFVGGFFGYNKFYEDYYTSMNLPFIRRYEPFPEQNPHTPLAQIGPEEIERTVPETIESLSGAFLDGADLYKEIYCAIDTCLKAGKEKKSLLKGLEIHKNDDEKLEEIHGLLLSPNEKKDAIKKAFSLDRYPGTIKKVRSYYQQIKSQQ